MAASQGASSSRGGADQGQSGSGAPESWLRSIDATYAIFEEEEHRKAHPRLAALVQEAVRLSEEVLDELGTEACALSFNGGKDCTVLVHMLAAVLRRKAGRRRGGQEASSNGALPALASMASLYITCTSPFDEVEAFVHDSIRRYNLRLVREDGGMKEGLENYLNGQGNEEETRPRASAASSQTRGEKRDIKAIFVGTRRTDPHGADLKVRSHTDPGWPDVERVQPILDWTYEDVWLFLRCPLFAIHSEELQSNKDGLQWGATYGVPYCSLYDEGYTSLGSTFNTFPNPVLDTQKGAPVDELDSARKQHRWLPAYRLEDESQERAGRGERSK